MTSEGESWSPPGRAAQRWAEGLAGWAIPPHILEAVPESPWSYSPAVFVGVTRAALAVETPSTGRARQALRNGASVLDVGVGAGAASLPLAPPAASITGVDSSPVMLDALADLASARGVAHTAVLGTWPDVASAVKAADVCVCHHVFYNVADLGPFASALTSHARRRVVVELTASHPQSILNPLWWHFHRLRRPSGPTADDAMAALAEAGIPVQSERWTSSSFHIHSRPDASSVCRRLACHPRGKRR